MIRRLVSARARSSARGATMLEFAFVMTPLLVVMVGILVFGTMLFYQQQINNAAKVAARYASIHSANADCPTVSWMDPAAPDFPAYSRCDKPQTGWRGIPPPLGQTLSAAPGLTIAARNALFGLDRSQVHVAACWSGFWRTVSGSSPPTKASSAAYDAPPPSDDAPDSVLFWCRLNGKDPRTATKDLACPESAVDGTGTVLTSDEGSDVPGNSVTVYICYLWTPPLAGFLGLPNTVTFRAVATEVIGRLSRGDEVIQP